MTDHALIEQRVAVIDRGLPPWAYRRTTLTAEEIAALKTRYFAEAYGGHVVLRECAHCLLPKEDRADGGKCLYAPTHFEPLTVEVP